MFDQYRKTGRSPFRNAVVFILFGSITIVFVLWGLVPHQPGMMGGVAAVAEVNGELISLADFDQERSRLAEMYSQMMGQKLDPDAQRQILGGEAVNRLIQFELLSQAARDQHLGVTSDEVRDLIVSIPAFQKDGVFQKSYYDAYLANSRTRASDLEKRIRKEQQAQRLTQLFQEAMLPLGPEAAKLWALDNTKLNVSFLRVSREALAKGLKTAPEEAQKLAASVDGQPRLQQYYDANISQFRQGETTRSFDDSKLEVAHAVLKEEAADRQLQALEDAVKKGDEQTVSAWASAHKMTWEETGDFALSSSTIPKIGGSEEVARVVFSLSKEKPMAQEVVRDVSGTFVVRLKSRTEPTAPLGNLKTQELTTANRRANESSRRFVEALRAHASIHENTEVLSQ